MKVQTTFQPCAEHGVQPCTHWVSTVHRAHPSSYIAISNHFLLPFPSPSHPEMEKERIFHPAFGQWPLPGDKACPAGDKQMSGRCPGPAMATAATHMRVAPSLLYLLHETWGPEGVRVGECQAGYFPSPHISTGSSVHTPTTHFSKASSDRVQGHAPCPLCHPSLTLGEEMVVLGRDVAAAPGPLSSPLALLGLQAMVCGHCPCCPRETRTETCRRAKLGHGASLKSTQEDRWHREAEGKAAREQKGLRGSVQWAGEGGMHPGSRGWGFTEDHG